MNEYCFEQNNTNSINNSFTNETENSFIRYNNLMELYIETITKLIDTSKSFGILPFRAIIGINWIKKYICENRFETLQNGLVYLLENKELVLNFSLENLDELDIDSDDNMSVKSCVRRYKNNQVNQAKYTNQDDNNFGLSNQDEMLNLMIDIKNNAKKLSESDIVIIKKYFELLIMILEQIKNIFV